MEVQGHPCLVCLELALMDRALDPEPHLRPRRLHRYLARPYLTARSPAASRSRCSARPAAAFGGGCGAQACGGGCGARACGGGWAARVSGCI